MYIVIPAYQPDEKMLRLIDALKAETDYKIVVVNDGSSQDTLPVFEAAATSCAVLHHDVNRGKGAALKTAYRYIQQQASPDEGIVTVDADGQHLVKDIIAVANEWLQNKDALVLGSRKFTGNVPFKSLTGNAITRFVFRISTGVSVYDTQTGLRAFGVSRIPMMLEMKGDRYEYEINVLLYATRYRIPIREVTIETVYIQDNASSHFHPVRDAWRIYKMILLFVASSVGSFLIDFIAFRLLRLIFPAQGLLFSEIIARAISSFCNYLFNKKMVFDGKGKTCIIRYYILAVFILAADYLILRLLNGIGVPELLGKLIAGIILYPVSFVLQRKYVFPAEASHEA